MKPRIAVSMGDPAGIGPEICLALLHRDPHLSPAVPVVMGSQQQLDAIADRLHQPRFAGPVLAVPNVDWTAPQLPDVESFFQNHCSGLEHQPMLLDISIEHPTEPIWGQASAWGGKSAFAFVRAGIIAAQTKFCQALATAPLCKESLHLAGIDFPGHTEMLAFYTNTHRYAMMLTSPEITCSLVTTHVPLAHVPTLISTEKIVNVAQLTNAFFQRLFSRPPRLTVLGLNPHAGENGMFGDEEKRIVQPAIDELKTQGFTLRGPLAPDTAFLPWQRQQTDAYICLYHDQGLIPLKTIAFDQAINVTLGLPIIRTSVDHGTAFDLVGTGTASPASLFYAVDRAAEFCRPY